MTDLLIKRFRDLEASPVVVEHPLPVPLHERRVMRGGFSPTRVAGRFRIETFKAYDAAGRFEIPGTRRVRAEFDNLITDNGLNRLGSVGLENTYFFHVGTGNTPETVGDTGLVTWVASKQNSTASLNGPGDYWAQSTPPYFASHQKQARFTAGFAGGAVNITEVGIGPGSGNTNMYSRALTVDGLGDPAAIPVDADEYFDIYYTGENYPGHINADGTPTNDTGSIDVNGTAYGYTIRPAYVTSGARWGRNMWLLVEGACRQDGSTWYGYYVYGSDATLGAVTSGLASGSSASVQSTSCTEASYVTDTFQKKVYYPFSLSQGNVSGGIGGMLYVSTRGGYQVVFDAPIPKTSSDTLSMSMTHAWTRKAA